MTVEEKRRRDECFIEAIRQNRAGMFRVARMMLRSDSDAEEAVADATACAYAHIHTRRKRELPSDDAALFDRPIAPREAENIWALVERLDALYSVPLVMAYAEGMKLEEIAAALHVPKGTVSARMTRGRQKLKTWMEEER